MNNIWHPLEQMEFEYRSGNKSLWWGGANYKPITGNKETDKILKKKSYYSPGQTLLNTIFYGHGTTRGDEIADIEEGM